MQAAPSCHRMRTSFQVGLWLLLGALRGFGAGQGGLDIDPLRTELACDPGAVQRGTITLANRGSQALALDVSFEDQSQSRFPGWIRIETGRREIGPGETVAVRYTVSIPTNAAGEFYGRVGFSGVQADGPQSGVGINTRISVPLSVTVKGTEVYRAEIRSVLVKSTDPLSVEVAVENRGNVHLRPVGQCEIRDLATGGVLRRFPVNEQGFPVYPGVETRLAANASEPLGPGTYALTIRIPFPDEKNLLTRTEKIVIADAMRPR